MDSTILRLQKLAGLLKESEDLEEISFASGHASSSDLRGIARSVMYSSTFDTSSIRSKLYSLGAFIKGSNGDYDFELRLDDKLVKVIKSKAIDILSASDVEILIFKKSKNDNLCALVNPNAITLGTYFLGVIKIEFETDSYGAYSISKAVDMPYYQIHWSNVASEFRGMGVGKQLYSLVYEWAKSKGAALASDDTLFAGSAGMWTTYMPQIASYFGVLMGNIIVPISKEEALLDKFKYFSSVDGFIAFDTPSKTMRKILYNLQGLSYSKGEIFTSILYTTSVNKSTIFDLVDSSDNIADLLTSIEDQDSYSYNEQGGKMSLKSLNRSAKISTVKAAVFAYRDAIVIVKTVSTGEEEVLPKDQTIDKKTGKKIKPKKITRLVAVTI
jgi:ribosomal protein S18 acetylase RimI-like enzyme